MEPERWWPWFVDAVTVVWVCLFAADVAASAALLTLSGPTSADVRLALRWLFVVFVLDLAVLYRQSDDGLGPFLRSNWFLVLTALPLFRPLRVLRVGRGLRALRLLVQSRRLGAFANKLRRVWGRLRSWVSRRGDR
jgi:hypothetical protein